MPTLTRASNAHAIVATGWTNPSNAFAASGDNVYATALNGSTTKNISWSGDFGFADIDSSAIPDGSTIDAVRIRCEANLSHAVVGALFGVQGRISGVNSGTEATKTTTGEAEVVTTLAGVTLANLRSASTVVKARCRGAKGNSSTGVTVFLDYVRLEVDYSGPPPLEVQDASHGHTADSPTLVENGKYNVWRTTTDPADDPAAVISTGTEIASGVTAKSHQDTTAANGTQYWYVTEAEHSGGTSDPSNIATATPTSGGVELVVQDAGHAHTADNVTLTQAHTLVVQDAAHAHTADNATLAEPGTTFDVPSEIDDTGATDVTAAINAWLANDVPNGSQSDPSIALFGVGKTYRIDSSVNLLQRPWIVLDGNGSTFIRPNAPSGENIRHFTFDRCTDLTVRNINVSGSITSFATLTWSSVTGRSGGDGEYDHAFAFRGCARVTHIDCDAQDIWGDGVYLGVGLSGTAPTSDYTATRVDMRRIARGGLQVIHASGVLFEDCDVDIQSSANYSSTGDFAGLFGLNVEPNNGDAATDVTFRDIRLGVTRLPGMQVVGDSSKTSAATVDGVTFDSVAPMAGANAVLFFEARPGVDSFGPETFVNHRYSNITVIDCPFAVTSPPYFWGPQPGHADLYPFMRFMLIDGVTVTGNTQPGQSDRLLVYHSRCSDVTVSGNTITGYTDEVASGTVPIVGVELVVADASHAHSADNVVLTQAHTLVVDDSTHGHTAENIILTAEPVLTLGSWRCYTDAAADSAMTPLAAENVKPTLTGDQMQNAVVRLRLQIAETGGGSGSGAVTLQYGADGTNWNTLTGPGGGTVNQPNYWLRFADGAATGGGTVDELLLDGSDEAGKYHEDTGVSASVGADAVHELDCALQVRWPAPDEDIRIRVLYDGTLLDGEILLRTSSAADRPHTIARLDADASVLTSREPRFSAWPRVFHDGTRWWTFLFQPGTPTVLRSWSWDGPGNPWVARDTATFTVNGDQGRNAVHMEIVDGVPTVYVVQGPTAATRRLRRGTISGTTITWGSQVNLTQDSRPWSAISADDGGRIWIAGFALDDSGVWARQSTNIDDVTAFGSAHTATDSGVASQNVIAVVGLASGKALAVWRNGSALKWATVDSDGFSSPATLASTANPQDWGLTRTGGFVYLVHTDATSDGGNWKLKVYDEAEGWSDGPDPGPSGQNSTSDGIAVTHAGDDVYAVGTFPGDWSSDRVLHYVRYTGPGDDGSWGSQTALSPSGRGNGDRVVAPQTFGGGLLVFGWDFGDDDQFGTAHAYEYHTIEAAGAIVLVVADASHGHSAEDVSLTQTHALAVDDAAHGHTADSVALTQDHLLAVDDATHGHTADSVALTQAHTLAVADTSHEHDAETPTLVQQHVLAVDDSVHGHTADNATLGVAGTLDVADAAHAHTAENVALAQAHQLAVQDAEHSHTADSAALTQAHTLAVADSSHAHDVDTPTLTQAHTLAVDDAAHAHTGDNVVLGVAGTLAVQDSLHGHTAENVALTQAHTLAVDDAVHAHTADSVALVQTHSITVDDAEHAHAADNVTLAVAGTLGVDDSTHSHTADNVALTQAHTLEVDNALHAHSAEGVDLTEALELEVADATHGHTVENIDLIQIHVLSVDDATHVHTADSFDLTQAHVLVVQNALHAHTVDQIVLGVIPTPPERIFVVLSESRITVIDSETRTVLVEAESRSATVNAEIRIADVPAESRILTV